MKMKSHHVNIHFLRHAQTTFNKFNEQFKQRDPMYNSLSFDQLSLLSDFRTEVRFNPQHIDCSITQKGRQECKMVRQKLVQKNIKPDIILVSPFNRTLETCHHIFGPEINIPIVAEPLVGQIMKSSCDVSLPLQHKIDKYSFYDFSECQKLGDYWFIKKNELQFQRNFEKILLGNQNNYIEAAQSILTKMNIKNVVETQGHLKERSIRLIKKLNEIYSQKYKEIMIITHFMLIDCISANNYDQSHRPLDGIKAKNCQIHSIKLKQFIQKL